MTMLKKDELDMNVGRVETFQRNPELEGVLADVNERICELNTPAACAPQYPMIMLMGCPRSGSTVFLQWLAMLGIFGYPSNLVARFYGNPWLGVKVHKILVENDDKNQLGIRSGNDPFMSRLGHTQGANQPSEFWYFWRRYFRFGEIQRLEQHELEAVDVEGFLQDLSGMEIAFDKPLVMKGAICNWHIPFLTALCDRFLFVTLKRDLFYVAQSIYRARREFFGDVQRWWSFKPPEYLDVRECSPLEQVAAQAVYTQRAIDEGMQQVDESRRLEVSYEDFCEDPRAVFEQIRSKYADMGYALPAEYKGPASFECSGKVRLDENCEKELRVALERFLNDDRRPICGTD